MRQSVHDSLLKFGANAELVAKIRAVARAQNKTPSEYMRHVLNKRVQEDA